MHLFARTILWGLLLLTLETAEAQSRNNLLNDSKEVDVTFNKTSSIIFHAVIKSVDRGSRDVLVQKAKGVDNILQLKAARTNFPETNITVITADGMIHQFTVHYARQPDQLVVMLNDYQNNELSEASRLIFETKMTELDMETYADQVSKNKSRIRFVHEGKYKINLALHGIYIRDNIFFYQFEISNRSNINYDVDFLRFYIQDKEKVKRTASQEVSVKPIYVFGNDKVVKGKSTEVVVYALDKFTIPDAKRLVIEMFEKNGGRNLNLAIKNKTIVNARLIE